MFLFSWFEDIGRFLNLFFLGIMFFAGFFIPSLEIVFGEVSIFTLGSMFSLCLFTLIALIITCIYTCLFLFSIIMQKKISYLNTSTEKELYQFLCFNSCFNVEKPRKMCKQIIDLSNKFHIDRTFIMSIYGYFIPIVLWILLSSLLYGMCNFAYERYNKILYSIDHSLVVTKSNSFFVFDDVLKQKKLFKDLLKTYASEKSEEYDTKIGLNEVYYDTVIERFEISDSHVDLYKDKSAKMSNIIKNMEDS